MLGELRRAVPDEAHGDSQVVPIVVGGAAPAAPVPSGPYWRTLLT